MGASSWLLSMVFKHRNAVNYTFIEGNDKDALARNGVDTYPENIRGPMPFCCAYPLCGCTLGAKDC